MDSPQPSSAPWMALPKLGRRAIKSDTEFIERSWKSQKLHSVALLKRAFSRLEQEIRKNNINKYCTPESEKHWGFWDWAWIAPKNSSVSNEERTTSELQGEHIATRLEKNKTIYCMYIWHVWQVQRAYYHILSIPHIQQLLHLKFCKFQGSPSTRRKALNDETCRASWHRQNRIQRIPAIAVACCC